MNIRPIHTFSYSTRFPSLLLSLFFVSGLFVLSSAMLSAQSAESSSWILFLSPDTPTKSVSEALRQVASEHRAELSTQSIFPSVGTSRTTLANTSLDRYLVVDWRGAGPPVSLLRSVKGVEAIYPNHTYHIEESEPNDSLFSEQWGLKRVGALKAWERTAGDQTVLIGIIDTGIEWEHEDLQDALWVNPAEDLNKNGRFDPWPSSEVRDGVAGDLDGIDQDGNGYPDDLIGFDMVDQNIPNFGDWSERDGVPFDEQGHGTNVAGVIGGVRNNRIGISGIAPNCRLVIIRAFDATGDSQDDDVAAAIVYGATIGVDVLNMSFGDTYNSPLLEDAVRFAHSRGVVMVASSGNDGVPDPHYPSGFDEVISVGATTDRDLLTFFSAYGSQLSLVAPGESILTTNRNNGYRTVSGTSFSAPHVAGVAALLRSLHPDWSADEVRGVLELSSSDLGSVGWDIDFGAGLLDAARAVNWPGSSVLKINSPRTNEGASVDSTVKVFGSAVAPFLESWTLEIGSGELPEEWRVLNKGNEGVFNGLLGTFTTADLEEGVQTIRLRLLLTTGRSFERRIRFTHDRTPPVVVASDIRNIWLYDRSVLGVTLMTDDQTRATLWLRPTGSGEPFLPYELEAERSGMVKQHFRFITSDELTPGLPYDLYIRVVNAAGSSTLLGDPLSPISVKIRDESFPVTTMIRKPWSAPNGYVLPQAPSIVDPEVPELLMNSLDGFAFGNLVLYQFSGTEFVPFDSAESWLPRGVGDSDGDKLMEVLGQSSGSGIIFEQREPGGSPFDDVLYTTPESEPFYPSMMYDFNADGKDEVIGYKIDPKTKEQYYVILEREGNNYREIARLSNPTPPDVGSQVNVLGASDIVISDVNGNGQPEILFSDNDDDFILYERNSQGGFDLIWSEENDGSEGDNRNIFAAGDVDNDGKDELLLVYRAPLFRNDDREYQSPLWTIRLMKFDEQNNAQEIAREEVAWVRGSTDFRTGVSFGNLDNVPGDEIAISLFPSLYLFQWDASLGRLKPFWWRGGSIINQPIIRDFDKDQTNELGVGDGNRINFYQIDPTFSGPLPPAGFVGWALSDSSIYLRWEDVPQADSFRVYRALLDLPGDQIRFDLVATVVATEFVDTGVATAEGRLQGGRTYGYIVTAIDESAPNRESRGSEALSVFTHNSVKLVSAEGRGGKQVLLKFSGDLDEGFYRNGAIEVLRESDGRLVELSSLLYKGERSLLVTFLTDQSGQVITVRPTAMMRDRFNSPVDTAVSLSVALTETSGNEVAVFIAVKAEPVPQKKIAITFNDEISVEKGTSPESYQLDPPGSVIGVEVDPTDNRRVLLQLEESYPLGPFGIDYTITISNVESAQGLPLNGGAGSVVGFTISAESLDQIFVYPHPFSLSQHGSVTFAGLPNGALIRIYTQSGAILRELNVTSGDGGSEWDGRDNRGNLLPTGVYLYSVVTLDAGGGELESRLKKIAVVP